MKEGNILSIKIGKAVKKYGDIEDSPYQFAYVLYDNVQAAQRAIQLFDNSYIFGPKPLTVEAWISKEEKE